MVDQSGFWDCALVHRLSSRCACHNRRRSIGYLDSSRESSSSDCKGAAGYQLCGSSAICLHCSGGSYPGNDRRLAPCVYRYFLGLGSWQGSGHIDCCDCCEPTFEPRRSASAERARLYSAWIFGWSGLHGIAADGAPGVSKRPRTLRAGRSRRSSWVFCCHERWRCLAVASSSVASQAQ